MERGKFISIEGSEGAGKSTALEFIKQYFHHAKIESVWTREPGGTTIAEEIRRLTLTPNQNEKMTADTELLLMFAARTQHIATCISPALNTGKWVVSDRYIDATYAYQGGGRQMDQQRIAALDHLFVASLYPDLTLLLDVPTHIGVERTEKRGTAKDRIEQEQDDFFMRVRNTYLERAKAAPQRIKIIDASLAISEVEKQIQHALDAFIAGDHQ